MARGRPSLYKPEYSEQAFRLCLLGMTNQELAKYFDVADTTIDKWIKEIPEFSGSIKSGRADADANVTVSLYKRGLGYSHPDIDIRVIDGIIVKTEIIKHYPPDPAAMIFWLKNRQIGRWRDRVDQDVKITHRTLAEELAEMNGKPSSNSN